MTACTHLNEIRAVEVPAEIEGCEECLKTGDRWVHLRMCMICGRVGCCDSSPNQHASRHAHDARHSIIRSAEPGEEWCWCFVDDIAFSPKEARTGA